MAQPRLYPRRLREHRLRCGLGVNELARRIGVDPAVISRAENDPGRSVSIGVWRRLAEVLGVPHEALGNIVEQRITARKRDQVSTWRGWK